MDSLEGKTALVTGSAHGLGAVIAGELASRGARVLVNCHSHPAKAEAVVAEIRSAGGSAELFVCDVADEAMLKEKLSPLSVDILVNNARRDPYARPEGISDGAWFETLLHVNLTGAYLCTLAVMEGMKARHWGRILNVSSVQAFLGMDLKMLPYSVSKLGMHALTRCFAAALGEYGITVNTLAPGMVITENIRKRLSKEEIDARLKKYPLHRAATGAEIAEIAVNVLQCGGMTGETVNVNSGVWFAP